jgi:hypothetical protein
MKEHTSRYEPHAAFLLNKSAFSRLLLKRNFFVTSLCYLNLFG